MNDNVKEEAMGYDLDVPDGLTARAVIGEDGARLLEFYTGRFATRFDSAEVRELVAALQRWLDDGSPPPNEGRDARSRR